MKNLLGVLGAAIFAVVAGFSINAGLSNDAELDVALDKIEAIAQNEGVTIDCTQSNCKGGKCHKTSSPFNPDCVCVPNGDPTTGCYA